MVPSIVIGSKGSVSRLHVTSTPGDGAATWDRPSGADHDHPDQHERRAQDAPFDLTPDAVRERIEARRVAGATSSVLIPVGADRLAALEELARVIG